MKVGPPFACASWRRFPINEIAAERCGFRVDQSSLLLQKGNKMAGLKNYKALDVWQLGMALVETTYRVTEALPDKERYGLTSQMRRCSVSIPSNIAEGQSRGTAKFGLYFIRVAIGSICELDTQVELTRRLHFLTADGTRELDEQLDRVRKMLYGMRREHEQRLAAAGAAIVSLLFVLRSIWLFA